VEFGPKRFQPVCGAIQDGDIQRAAFAEGAPDFAQAPPKIARRRIGQPRHRTEPPRENAQLVNRFDLRARMNLPQERPKFA
jgi:hypothetical protein